MVCVRCKMIVKSELEKLGLYTKIVELGYAETTENITDEQIQVIKRVLMNYDLDLLDNKKDILVEKIKNAIVEMVHFSDCGLKTNFSAYLSNKLNLDYTYLANTFSTELGTTIEHFIILHKISRIKELIGYNELNLTEISWKLHYSSVAHLSAQFKKITGITPTYFKHSVYRAPESLKQIA